MRWDEEVRPGYFVLPPLEVRRAPPPKRLDGWFGRLAFWATCRTSVHVGSGAPELVRLRGKPALIEGFATLPGAGGQRLVIPGSSMKGAVRAVVEALTPSCERTAKDGCEGRGELCAACVLLGAPGWRATVAFSDLVPVDRAHRVAPKRIAQRYSHTHAPVRGRRLYRREPESPLPRDCEVVVVLEADSRLAGEVVASGATEVGLGLLTIALGLPPNGLPYLRLGGGKNRGLGVVTVELTSVEGTHGVRPMRAGSPVPSDTVSRWQKLALDSSPELKSRVELIRTHYGEP